MWLCVCVATTVVGGGGGVGCGGEPGHLVGGLWACTELAWGRMCRAECRPGYLMTKDPPSPLYICGSSTGRWHHSTQLPVCTREYTHYGKLTWYIMSIHNELSSHSILWICTTVSSLSILWVIHTSVTHRVYGTESIQATNRLIHFCPFIPPLHFFLYYLV